MSQPKTPLRRNGFTFKQFFVAHDRCAMKVGTDGILLGAWAPVAKAQRVLDIGAGSGLLTLMLAQRTDDTVTLDAVELDAQAAEQARENIDASPWAARIQVHSADIQTWTQQQTQRYELIVSNPPYIDGDDPHLSQGDVRFEPKSALVADNAGLADLETLVTEARRFLEDNGWLMLEHGWQQGEAVRELFTRAGYQAVETCRDYGGNERLTLGHYRDTQDRNTQE